MDQPLTKQDVEKIVQDKIDSYMNEKQFSLSKIPAHKHNGLDVQKIEENDLLPANQFSLNWISTSSEVFTISKIPNLSLIRFFGVATNGVYGGGPYAEKASISGEVRIATVYPVNSSNGNDYYANGDFKLFDGTSVSSQYYQACTSTYLKTTDSTKLFVSSSSVAFALVTNDGVSNEVVNGRVTKINNDSVEITITLTPSWYLRGYFFFS